jgi:hypothetical protein
VVLTTNGRYKRIAYNPMTALQALVPRTALSHSEALIVAEIQATALLKMLQIEQPPAPVLKLARHLDVVTRHDPEAGTIGYCGIQDGTWYICYGDKTLASRDATVAHHLKRIIDAPFGDSLYPPIDVMATRLRQYYVAEYFATCLTLPARWVERDWRRGRQNVDSAAGSFGVTREAMLFRLKVLRMIGPSDQP